LFIKTPHYNLGEIARRVCVRALIYDDWNVQTPHPAKAGTEINGQDCAGGACSKTAAIRKSGPIERGANSATLNSLVGAGALIKSAAGEWLNLPEATNVTAQE